MPTGDNSDIFLKTNTGSTVSPVSKIHEGALGAFDEYYSNEN